MLLEALEADERDELLGPPLHRRPIEALVHLHSVAHVARDRSATAGGSSAGRPPPIDAGAVHASAVDADGPEVVAHQPGHDVEQRRLAAAARPDDRHELALGHRERHVERASTCLASRST